MAEFGREPQSPPPDFEIPETRFEQLNDVREDPNAPPETAANIESEMREKVALRLKEKQELTDNERAFLVEDLVNNRHESELGRLSLSRNGFKNAQDVLRKLDLKEVEVKNGAKDEKGDPATTKISREEENGWKRMPAWARRMVVQGGVSGALTTGGLIAGGLLTGPAGWVGLGAWAGGMVGSGLVEATRHRHLQKDTKEERSLAYRSGEDLFKNIESAAAIGKDLANEEDPEKRAEIISKVIDQIQNNQTDNLKRYNRADKVYSALRILGSVAGSGLGGWATQAAMINHEIVARGAHGITRDFDGDGVPHFIQRLKDGYHYVIKNSDISKAHEKVAEMGSHFAPFHVVTSSLNPAAVPHEVGHQALYHLGRLDSNHINDIIRNSITDETYKAMGIAAVMQGLTTGAQEIFGRRRNRDDISPEESNARIENLRHRKPVYGPGSGRDSRDEIDDEPWPDMINPEQQAKNVVFIDNNNDSSGRYVRGFVVDSHQTQTGEKASKIILAQRSESDPTIWSISEANGLKDGTQSPPIYLGEISGEVSDAEDYIKQHLSQFINQNEEWEGTKDEGPAQIRESILDDNRTALTGVLEQEGIRAEIEANQDRAGGNSWEVKYKVTHVNGSSGGGAGAYGASGTREQMIAEIRRELDRYVENEKGMMDRHRERERVKPAEPEQAPPVENEVTTRQVIESSLEEYDYADKSERFLTDPTLLKLSGDWLAIIKEPESESLEERKSAITDAYWVRFRELIAETGIQKRSAQAETAAKQLDATQANLDEDE